MIPNYLIMSEHNHTSLRGNKRSIFYEYIISFGDTLLLGNWILLDRLSILQSQPYRNVDIYSATAYFLIKLPDIIMFNASGKKERYYGYVHYQNHFHVVYDYQFIITGYLVPDLCLRRWLDLPKAQKMVPDLQRSVQRSNLFLPWIIQDFGSGV